MSEWQPTESAREHEGETVLVRAKNGECGVAEIKLCSTYRDGITRAEFYGRFCGESAWDGGTADYSDVLTLREEQVDAWMPIPA